jgi:calcineurin-like phosphoesterase
MCGTSARRLFLRTARSGSSGLPTIPPGTPGRGSNLYIARNGARVLVANVMGRVFMHPDLDDPFSAGEAILEACPLGEVADAVVFDFHAEATSEKLCFATFCRWAGKFRGGHPHPCADC